MGQGQNWADPLKRRTRSKAFHFLKSNQIHDDWSPLGSCIRIKLIILPILQKIQSNLQSEVDASEKLKNISPNFFIVSSIKIWSNSLRTLLHWIFYIFSIVILHYKMFKKASFFFFFLSDTAFFCKTSFINF